MRHAMVVIWILVIWLALRLAWADVVELKTGQRVEGTFKQATPAGVVIEVGGQTITFEQEKVRAIYFGSAPSAQAQPSALDEALKALKGLQSVTSGDVSYRDYAPRVTDAKIVVDRYLQQPEHGDGNVRVAITDAMSFYDLASSAWNARVTRSYGAFPSLGSDPAIAKCPAAQRAIEASLSKIPASRRQPWDAGIALSFDGVRGLWSCASDKIAEAERAMPAGGK